MVHIQFGIEIEFLLGPKGEPETTRAKDFAEKLKDEYESHVAEDKLAWPGMENACEYKNPEEAGDAKREEDCENEYVDAMCRIRDAEKKLDSARKKLEKAEDAKVDQAKADVVEAEKKVEGTTTKFYAVKKRIDEWNKKIGEEEEAVKEAIKESKLEEAKQKRNEAREKVKKAKAKVKEGKGTKTEVEEAQAEAKEAEAKLEVAEAELKVAEEIVKVEKTKLDATKQKIDDRYKRIEEAKKKVEDAKQKGTDVVEAKKGLQTAKKVEDEDDDDDDDEEEEEEEELKLKPKAEEKDDEDEDEIAVAMKKIEAARKRITEARKRGEKAKKEAEEAQKDYREATKEARLIAERKHLEAEQSGQDMAKPNKDLADATWMDMPDSFKKGYGIDKWTLVEDISVTVPNGKFGIELVSPILRFNESRFRDLVRGVFSRIEDSCTIETNDSCGTHVHISLSSGFSTLQVFSIARAVLYFEPAITALVPKERQNANHCKTFLSGSHPKFMTPKVAIAKVDELDWRKEYPISFTHTDIPNSLTEAFSHPITKLMNPEADRQYTWNFTSLPRTNTIEFRQPPGVTSAAETLMWVEFAVTFVNAALVKAIPDTEDLEGFPMNVGGLKQFLKAGEVSGISDSAILDQITHGVADGLRVPLLQVQQNTV